MEALCDTIGVIKSGRIIEQGGMDEIKALINRHNPPTLEALFLDYYEKGRRERQ